MLGAHSGPSRHAAAVMESARRVAARNNVLKIKLAKKFQRTVGSIRA